MALFHRDASAWACDVQFFLFIFSLILAVVSCIHLCSHHCAALQRSLFCPIIRTHNTQMSSSFTNYLRKKNEAWLSQAKIRTNQVNSFPSSHLFAPLLEMVIGKNPNLSPNCSSHSTTLLPLSLHTTDCETKRLGWVEPGCHLCLAQRCFLSPRSQLPTLLSCFTPRVTGTTLRTALGANLRVPKTQLQRMHPNSPL